MYETTPATQEWQLDRRTRRQQRQQESVVQRRAAMAIVQPRSEPVQQRNRGGRGPDGRRTNSASSIAPQGRSGQAAEMRAAQRAPSAPTFDLGALVSTALQLHNNRTKGTPPSKVVGKQTAAADRTSGCSSQPSYAAALRGVPEAAAAAMAGRDPVRAPAKASGSAASHEVVQKQPVVASRASPPSSPGSTPRSPSALPQPSYAAILQARSSKVAGMHAARHAPGKAPPSPGMQLGGNCNSINPPSKVVRKRPATASRASLSSSAGSTPRGPSTPPQHSAAVILQGLPEAAAAAIANMQPVSSSGSASAGSSSDEGSAQADRSAAVRQMSTKDIQKGRHSPHPPSRVRKQIKAEKQAQVAAAAAEERADAEAAERAAAGAQLAAWAVASLRAAAAAADAAQEKADAGAASRAAEEEAAAEDAAQRLAARMVRALFAAAREADAAEAAERAAAGAQLAARAVASLRAAAAAADAALQASQQAAIATAEFLQMAGAAHAYMEAAAAPMPQPAAVAAPGLPRAALGWAYFCAGAVAGLAQGLISLRG